MPMTWGARDIQALAKEYTDAMKASWCSIWRPVLLAIQDPTDIAVFRARDAEAADLAPHRLTNVAADKHFSDAASPQWW
jgi:hypothetical protein